MDRRRDETAVFPLLDVAFLAHGRGVQVMKGEGGNLLATKPG